MPGWGERYCNDVNYLENNAFFEPPSMRACSSTPPKQNQDFVKEHNRTPLSKNELGGSVFSSLSHRFNKCPVHPCSSGYTNPSKWWRTDALTEPSCAPRYARKPKPGAIGAGARTLCLYLNTWVNVWWMRTPHVWTPYWKVFPKELRSAWWVEIESCREEQ